jgi:hypothetical protein
MNRHAKIYLLIFTALVSLLIISSVYSEEKSPRKKVPYFTNQDLEKYRYPSDRKPAVDSGTESAPTGTPDSSLDDIQKTHKLKRYVIPYKAFEGSARRIIIEVIFNNRISAPMLLDTGAPGVHLSFDIAEKLGLLSRDEEHLWIEISGIGGAVPAIYKIIDTIEVGEARGHFVPTTISYSTSSDYEGLIGMDFLSNYTIEIDSINHKLVLEALPERPGMPAGYDETWWRKTFRNFTSMESGWKQYKEYLDKQDSNSRRLSKLKTLAAQQYRAAQQLNQKLWKYASEHAVPQPWRR